MNETVSNQSTTEVPETTETPSKILSDLASRVAALERRPENRPEKTDFQSWTAVVTLSALAIYGAARFGDTAFYARLGTDADTVGLNYGVTLARVATSVVVAGAGVVALPRRPHATVIRRRTKQISDRFDDDHLVPDDRGSVIVTHNSPHSATFAMGSLAERLPSGS